MIMMTSPVPLSPLSPFSLSLALSASDRNRVSNRPMGEMDGSMVQLQIGAEGNGFLNGRKDGLKIPFKIVDSVSSPGAPVEWLVG